MIIQTMAFFNKEFTYETTFEPTSLALNKFISFKKKNHQKKYFFT